MNLPNKKSCQMNLQNILHNKILQLFNDMMVTKANLWGYVFRYIIFSFFSWQKKLRLGEKRH